MGEARGAWFGAGVLRSLAAIFHPLSVVSGRCYHEAQHGVHGVPLEAVSEFSSLASPVTQPSAGSEGSPQTGLAGVRRSTLGPPVKAPVRPSLSENGASLPVPCRCCKARRGNTRIPAISGTTNQRSSEAETIPANGSNSSLRDTSIGSTVQHPPKSQRPRPSFASQCSRRMPGGDKEEAKQGGGPLRRPASPPCPNLSEHKSSSQDCRDGTARAGEDSTSHG